MKKNQDIKLMYCPVTGHKMAKIFSAKVLNQYDVQYYYSDASGILLTETPYWLDEAYSHAIAATDTGILRRNFLHLLRSVPLLNKFTDIDSKILDIGGGYGLLTRMLRDVGFDCYSYDKYCQNLFAEGFEPEADFMASVLFAFEVFEHIENPQTFLEENFEKYSCKTIIFSTQTFNHVPEKDWWYYAFETGQHITFYQPRTLKLLAEKNNCLYYDLGKGFHLITDQILSMFEHKIFSSRTLSSLRALYLMAKRREQSKTQKDSDLMKEKIN